MKNAERFEKELRRIDGGPYAGEKPGGIGTVRFEVICPLGAPEVLVKAKSILKAIDNATLAGWPEEQQVIPRLPDWFVKTCPPPAPAERTREWLAHWRTLPPDERAKAEMERSWDLENWLYWMEHANRQWFWWDADTTQNFNKIDLAIEVETWPFPWGALRWMFKAAGASIVEPKK